MRSSSQSGDKKAASRLFELEKEHKKLELEVKNLQLALSEERKRGDRVVAAEKEARRASNDQSNTKALLAEVFTRSGSDALL